MKVVACDICRNTHLCLNDDSDMIIEHPAIKKSTGEVFRKRIDLCPECMQKILIFADGMKSMEEAVERSQK